MSKDVPSAASSRSSDDAKTAIRFLAVKAAIFILVPLIAAAAAIMLLLK